MKYWMVFKDGKHGKKPKFKHETKADACFEAMRLANLRPCETFVVVEFVTSYCFEKDQSDD